MLKLLKEQLQQHGIVTATSTTLPQPSETVDDPGTSLSPTSADGHDTTDDFDFSLEPTDPSDVGRLTEQPRSATTSLGRSVSSRYVRARPPLEHTASLPSHYHEDTSIPDMTSSSSLATVLMDRMSSLENRVAEQQRQSEAAITRLLGQVCMAVNFRFLDAWTPPV